MAKKKGFFGTVGRLLGSIPVVGKAKKAGKAVKKKVKAVKKKAKKTVKKVKKKLKKKVGKVFTKARKLKNNLSKSKLVKKVKRTVKKVVVKTKKVVKKAKSKAKAVVKSAKQKTKKAVQQVKQTAKKTVQQTKQQLKTVVKETKKAAAKVGGKVAAAYTSFKAGGYKETLSVVADCIPIVGNAKSAYEAISGKDPFTGRKLEEWERTVAAAAVLGGPAVKAVKHGGKLVGGIVKNTSPAIAKNVEKLTNALEQIQLSVASPRPTVQLAMVSGTGQSTSTLTSKQLTKQKPSSINERTKRQDVAEVNQPNKGNKIDSTTIKKYIRDIENRTSRKLPKKQIENLKEALRNKEYKKMSIKETAKHRREFNKVKNKVIEEWEENTGQNWPVYNKDVISEKTGKVIRKKGDKYDAHHIIENSFGGEHEWWNIHPAKFPNEHQAGLHGAGSPANTLFKGSRKQ